MFDAAAGGDALVTIVVVGSTPAPVSRSVLRDNVPSKAVALSSLASAAGAPG